MSTIKSVELREQERRALATLTNSLSRLCWVRAAQVAEAEAEVELYAQVAEAEAEAEIYAKGEAAIEMAHEKLCESIRVICAANQLGTDGTEFEQLDRIRGRIAFLEEQNDERNNEHRSRLTEEDF